jgi:aminodeoxyfutalosine synthase
MLEADVLTLGMAADEARRAVTGTNVVTYLRVHVVNPADLGTAIVIPAHAAEVRLYVTPPSFDEALAQVQAVAQVAGSRRVVAFSMAAIEARGWATVEALKTLADAGLMDVAELPVDQVSDLSRAIAVLRQAGMAARRVTTAHPLGDRKIDMIDRVTAAITAHPSVRRYAPLPRVAPVDKPTTGYDDVRMVALARLALGATSIEVDWSLYGPKLAQVALTFGADHLDGVSGESDITLGPRRGTVEDVERNIRAAGFEPREERVGG